MISYQRLILENGLHVLLHQDTSTPLAAVNVLYRAGSRFESEDLTGIAHLFEHLMFAGTTQVPSFDDLIQTAGGECNAFTNPDIANYYDILPLVNLEVALFLEADRMHQLNLVSKAVNVQKSVILEEFKETCLNEPYGDVWHHLLPLAYPGHPYSWPSIGKELSHISSAGLRDAKKFYKRYYHPGNAILSLGSSLDLDRMEGMVREYFSAIPVLDDSCPAIPEAAPLRGPLRKEVKAPVPVDALYVAFRMGERMSRNFYVMDLVTDVLSNGPSSRLYDKLVKEEKVFEQVDAYVSGTDGPGIFVLEGRPASGRTLEEGETFLWRELDLLCRELLNESELQKVKNKIESTTIYSDSNVLSKVQNLAYYESLGNADLINEELSIYQQIQAEEVRHECRQTFVPENSICLFYRSLG